MYSNESKASEVEVGVRITEWGRFCCPRGWLPLAPQVEGVEGIWINPKIDGGVFPPPVALSLTLLLPALLFWPWLARVLLWGVCV
jgi:hypothetical protein